MFLGFDRKAVEQGMKQILQAARGAEIPVTRPVGSGTTQ